MVARTTAPNSSLTALEQDNVSRFFSAAVRQFGTQTALAKAAGISQSTIAGVIAQRYGGGHKAIAAVARVTGIAMEAITSGEGLIALESRRDPLFDAIGESNKLRAIRALAELYEQPLSDVTAVVDELGAPLAVGTPATVWFDVGRGAIERRAAGLALKRREQR